LVDPVAYTQNACFGAADIFAKTEGIIPAPESSHAIRAAIDEALKAKETNEEKVILFCLSGHGFLDVGSYEAYIDGKLVDYELPESELQAALADSAI
jgi:tryptophan synthase beta chain